MCCGSQCNPGFLSLQISLPVTAAAEPQVDEQWREKIAKELAHTVSEADTWKTQLALTSTELQLTLIPASGARPLQDSEVKTFIYFTEDGVVDSSKPQEMRLSAEGHLQLRLSRADAIAGGMPEKYISGVIVRPGGWNLDGSVRAMRIKGSYR